MVACLSFVLFFLLLLLLLLITALMLHAVKIATHSCTFLLMFLYFNIHPSIYSPQGQDPGVSTGERCHENLQGRSRKYPDQAHLDTKERWLRSNFPLDARLWRKLIPAGCIDNLILLLTTQSLCP